MLRLSMLLTYDVRQGYDFPWHLAYVRWFADHSQLPPLDLSRETYHPPLFYWLAAQLLVPRIGQSLVIVSILAGYARLGLIWLGLELYLPESQLARRVALLLASVLPASVHLDGMVTGEALNGFFAVAAMIVAPCLFSYHRRFAWAALLGVLIGLNALTKISALAIVGAFAATAVMDFAWTPRLLSVRIRRLTPWLAAFSIAAILSGWYFARNASLYGKPFLSGYDGPDRVEIVGLDRIPFYQRRSVSFLTGWSTDVLAFPYFPSGVVPRPYFWPVLVASTFADYYNHWFASPPPRDTPALVANGRPLRTATLWLSRTSVIGGVLIAVLTAAAWLGGFYTSWRRRQAGRVPLLLSPMAALIGQIYFAWQYPVDRQGPIKGVYLQFAAPPLCAVFGWSVTWLWRRRHVYRILACMGFGALALVALYTIYCRAI
jgi:hypothetical protein